MLSQTTENQGLYKALEELGLTSHEIRLYLLSLELGPTNIPVLADQLGVSRPNLYKVIQGLAEKGLAYLPQRKHYARKFVVESPSVVMERIRIKHESIKNLDAQLIDQLPSLLRKYQQGHAPTKVKLIYGEKDFIKTYIQVFEEAGGEIQFFGNLSEFIKMVGSEFGKIRIQRRVEKGVFVQALVLSSYEETGLKTNKEELREVRVLADADPFKTSFYLFANKAVLWQPESPLAILIEDEYLVKMFRSMFFLLWKNASHPEHSS